MKIKEELLDKILECVNITMGGHEFYVDKETLVDNVKLSGIEIEEPDYLAGARDKRLKHIGRDGDAHGVFELYEKAIKQEKEKKK